MSARSRVAACRRRVGAAGRRRIRAAARRVGECHAGGSAQLRPRRRADRPRDLRGLPPRRRDRPLCLPHRARPRESGRAAWSPRSSRAGCRPGPPAQARRATSVRRTGRWTRGSGRRWSAGRARSSSAPEARAGARRSARRLRSARRFARGESRLELAMASSYRPSAANGGTDDYRCFLLDPKLTSSALRHRGADRARHRLDRAPRDPVPHRSRLGRRGGRAGPQRARRRLDVLRRPRGLRRRERKPGRRPRTMQAGSPRGRPGGAATGCATARASRSRPEAGS